MRKQGWGRKGRTDEEGDLGAQVCGRLVMKEEDTSWGWGNKERWKEIRGKPCTVFPFPVKCEPGAHGEERGLRRLGTPHASDWEGCKQRGVDAQDRASRCTTAGNTPFIFLSFEGALGYLRAVSAALTRCQVCHSLSHQHSLLSLPVPSLSHAGSSRQALRTMRSGLKHAVNSSFFEGHWKAFEFWKVGGDFISRPSYVYVHVVKYFSTGQNSLSL